jgi:pseudaminic acid synthase
MDKKIRFNGHEIGAGDSVYFIAELSVNHNQSYERAIEVIKATKAAGALRSSCRRIQPIR